MTLMRFNPRAREGATIIICRFTRISVFQSARPRGRDIDCYTARCFGNLFQSARPRGRDQNQTSPKTAPPSFNPRAREGATAQIMAIQWVSKVSIRAPARARHPGYQKLSNSAHVSIRAPARARHRSELLARIGACFNPRAREGATFLPALERYARTGFQSARPRGRDAAVLPSLNHKLSFNPRAREGATDIQTINQILIPVSIRAPARARRLRLIF